MTDAQAALAEVREALEAMRGDWLGDGFTKLRRSQIVAVLDEQEAEVKRLRAAVMHEADCVDAAKAEIERLTAERDELRRQLAELRIAYNAACDALRS